MIHVEKKVEKQVEKKEVKEKVPAPKKVEKPIKNEPPRKVEKSVKKPTPKKDVESEDKFNGLHAYALVVKATDKAVATVTKNAIVTARTEETAKNRVQKEYPTLQLVSIKRIPDETGHLILKKVRNKAGIFFDDRVIALTKK